MGITSVIINKLPKITTDYKAFPASNAPVEV